MGALWWRRMELMLSSPRLMVVSLRVRWTKWAVVGTPSGKVQDVGLTSEVVWRD